MSSEGFHDRLVWSCWVCFAFHIEKVLTLWPFTSLPFSAEDSAHVQDQYTLLERQIIIEVRLRLCSASVPSSEPLSTQAPLSSARRFLA